MKNLMTMLLIAALFLASACSSARVLPNSITFHNEADLIEYRDRHDIAAEKFDVTGGVFGAYDRAQYHVVFRHQECLFEVESIGLQTWVFVDQQISEDQFADLISKL